MLSSTVRTNEAMETLGLKTIGKRGKFLEKTKEIAEKKMVLAKIKQHWPTNEKFHHSEPTMLTKM